MESIATGTALNTRLETQTILYPTLRQLVRLLPWDHKRVLGYLQEEVKSNPFVVEKNGSSDWSGSCALLADSLPDWYTPPGRGLSLQDHLYGQISVLSLSERQRQTLLYLSQWLSKSGYLEATAQAWASGSPWSPEELEAVVPLLQSLDPPGIGARSLQECLLLQLKDQPQSLPALLVRDYLAELADCTGSSLEAKQSREVLLQKLRERCTQRSAGGGGIEQAQVPPNLGEDVLVGAIHQIQALEPRPARSFGDDARIVTPDLKALLSSAFWQVSLVYEVEQRFCLNQEAIGLLTKQDRRNRDTQRLESLLQNAQSLLTALKQWQENILKVGQFLVERQQAFLSSRDRLDLVPTPQQLVAQAVGLSNATVSRIVRGRYLLIGDQSSRIVPLSSLCVPMRVGGRTPQQVQQLLIQLIQEESPIAPYSDEKLAQLLRIRFGLPIARRTVAKYRKLAGLEPAHNRK
jgi:RNA polymerase sigma-54 factor